MLWTVYQLRVRALNGARTVLERHQSEIRALNEQMIKAQEAERMRIAGELHDGVLQQITSLTLRLGKVRRQVPPDSEATATVSGLQQQLIQIGTDIRHISHELHPALLQEAGLPAALSSYCEEFSKVRGLPVSCETDESVKELSPGTALCLYRIAQEALGNAAKYSEAKKVEVRLTRSDGRVWLSVSDDGVGCAPDQVGKSGGLGLINMRERVLQLDGTFAFDSEPGRGTTVKVTVPFCRPAALIPENRLKKTNLNPSLPKNYLTLTTWKSGLDYPRPMGRPPNNLQGPELGNDKLRSERVAIGEGRRNMRTRPSRAGLGSARGG